MLTDADKTCLQTASSLPENIDQVMRTYNIIAGIHAKKSVKLFLSHTRSRRKSNWQVGKKGKHDKSQSEIVPRGQAYRKLDRGSHKHTCL